VSDDIVCCRCGADLTVDRGAMMWRYTVGRELIPSAPHLSRMDVYVDPQVESGVYCSLKCIMGGPT